MNVMSFYDADCKSPSEEDKFMFKTSFSRSSFRSRTFPAIAWEIEMRQRAGPPDAQMSKTIIIKKNKKT